MQAQFMSLATQIKGSSVINEKIFENRFLHVSELMRMGADIEITKQKAKIKVFKLLRKYTIGIGLMNNIEKTVYLKFMKRNWMSLTMMG